MNSVILKKREDIHCVILIGKLAACLYFRDCLFWKWRNRLNEFSGTSKLWLFDLISMKNVNIVKSLRLYLMLFKKSKHFYSIEIILFNL